jgi:hypothetical protein
MVNGQRFKKNVYTKKCILYTMQLTITPRSMKKIEGDVGRD